MMGVGGEIGHPPERYPLATHPTKPWMSGCLHHEVIWTERRGPHSRIYQDRSLWRASHRVLGWAQHDIYRENVL